ncbi:MAG: hypothetical protein QHH10_01225 [Peptococcaceae bacterium]|jgi:hypothetical protein|nr:hypothetical protein [Peptococcaceae bacterium]MDH7523917.1 hypothetical protein [Peptococcaceae bacterium]
MGNRLFAAIILLSVLISAVFCGCGGEKKAPSTGASASNQQAASEPAKSQPSAKPSNSSEEWMPWAGPKTLGPEKPLPSMWCLTLTHCYKAGSGYVIQVNSKGEWYDATVRKEGGQLKGTLTADELASVKEAAGKINWDQLPEKSTKDYVDYTAEKKTPAGPVGFVGYIIDYYQNQTNAIPNYKGKRIYVDFKVACAPEAKNLIEAMKPLLEKYIPPQK